MWEGTGVGSPFVYWSLRLLLLAILFYSGYGIAYGKRSFSHYAWISGIAYSLIQGLRWMRGADYYHYYNDIVTVFGQYPGLYGRGTITPDPEFLYDLFINVFHASGLPFWIAFIFYSSLLIGGVLLVFKHFPKAALWGLPFFFLLTVDSSENIIRQYFAAAFFFYAFYYYLENRRWMMWIMLVIPVFIHTSALIVELPFVILIYAINDKTQKIFSSKYLCIFLTLLFLYFYYVFDISYLSFLSDFLQEHFQTDEDMKMAYYVNNSDRWLTEEGSMNNVLGGSTASGSGMGLLNSVVTILSYLAIVIFGFKVQKDNKPLTIAYLLGYVAILLKVGFGDIELYARFYNWFVLLLPVIIGTILTSDKIKFDVRIGIGGILMLKFIWYSFIIMIFATSMFGYGFVWNADVNIW